MDIEGASPVDSNPISKKNQTGLLNTTTTHVEEKQISKGSMATVIGIFEQQFKKNEPLTIVKPGTQSRRFTHIEDTVEACYYAWKKNRCRHYSISNKKSYTILDVAKMFNTKIKYLPSRRGERYASALTSMNLSNKVYKLFGKISLRDYINNIIKFS